MADYINHVVQVYKRESGTHVKTIGTAGTFGNKDGQFDSPRGVCCTADGLLYVADWGNHCVQVFRQDTHAYVRQFGSKGTGDGQFQYPFGVCLGSDGLVYVTDGNNHRVQVFRHDNGLFVAKLGGGAGQGAGVGQLNSPRGVCCSQGGVLYVAEALTSRIHAFPVIQRPRE